MGRKPDDDFPTWVLELISREKRRGARWLIGEIREEAERRVTQAAEPSGNGGARKKNAPPRRDLFLAASPLRDGLDADNSRPPRMGASAHSDWSDYVDVGMTLGIDDLVQVAVGEIDPAVQPQECVTANAVSVHLVGDPRLPERLRELSRPALYHHVARSLSRLVKESRVRSVQRKRGTQKFTAYELVE